MRPEHLLNLGYTPTAAAALAEIASLLEAPQGGYVRLFDPTAGDGAALRFLAEALAEQGAKPETYAVELDGARYEGLVDNVDFALNADVTNNVSITPGSMSLALLNPPYDNTGGDKSVERQVIRRGIRSLVRKGGVAVLVIPERLLKWVGRLYMEWFALFPTHDPASPNQVVLIGRRSDKPHSIPPMGTRNPVQVPVVAEGRIEFAVRFLLARHMNAALAGLSSPEKFLYGDKAPETLQALHPLGPAHKAMLLIAARTTIRVHDAWLRVTADMVESKRVEVRDRGGEAVKVEVTRRHPVPKVFRLTAGTGKLEKLPLSIIADYADEVDQAVGVHLLVEVDEDGKPILHPQERGVIAQINRRMPPLQGRKSRGLYPAQVVKAVGMFRALTEGKRHAVLGLKEMGFGKTPISLTVLALMRARRRVGLTVVMSPPHLTRKWEREARRLHPDALVVRPKGTGEKRIAAVLKAVDTAAAGKRHVILVLSREELKLGPRYKVQLVPKTMDLGDSTYPRQYWVCPHCFRPAVLPKKGGEDGEGDLIEKPTWVSLEDKATPPERFRGHRCPHCGKPYAAPAVYSKTPRQMARESGTQVPFWRDTRHNWFAWQDAYAKWLRGEGKRPWDYEAPPAEMRRWPIADVIARAAKQGRIPGGLFLIVDEVHEYRNTSLQGIAFSRLLKAARWAVTLTGTLSNGKASDLYNLMRWLSPEFRALGMSKTEFVKTYGYSESERVIADKRTYGRSSKRTQFHELPGVSPLVYAFLFPFTSFGSLRELVGALPPYTERDIIVNGAIEEFSPVEGGRVWHLQGQAAFMQWLRAALGYNNIAAVPPSDGRDFHEYGYWESNEDGERTKYKLVLTLPALPPDALLPKEQKLLELLKEQKRRGRKTVILLEQTRKRPLADRLQRIINAHGLRAVVLDTDHVPASKREEWIEKHAPAMDVLIAHPKSVETGLDLVMFQTAIVYEAVYNVITLLQALRRIHRLGQTKPVEVYTLQYKGTMEPPAWSAIHRGVMWAVTVYGDFAPDDADPNMSLLTALAEQLKKGQALDTTPPETVTLSGFAAKEIAIAREPEELTEETPPPPQPAVAPPSSEFANLPLFAAATFQPADEDEEEDNRRPHAAEDWEQAVQLTLFDF